jgi:hypothetical protein
MLFALWPNTYDSLENHRDLVARSLFQGTDTEFSARYSENLQNTVTRSWTKKMVKFSVQVIGYYAKKMCGERR